MRGSNAWLTPPDQLRGPRFLTGAGECVGRWGIGPVAGDGWVTERGGCVYAAVVGSAGWAGALLGISPSRRNASGIRNQPRIWSRLARRDRTSACWSWPSFFKTSLFSMVVRTGFTAEGAINPAFFHSATVNSAKAGRGRILLVLAMITRS